MLPVVRAQFLDASRQQLVTRFVLGFFTPMGARRQMPMLNSITCDEVRSVVLDTLHEHGHFPLHADMVEGDPPMYFGEQIRRLDDGSYLVANIEFYDHASTDGKSTQCVRQRIRRRCVLRSRSSEQSNVRRTGSVVVRRTTRHDSLRPSGHCRFTADFALLQS